jgi:hypothetical protein
MPENCDGYTSTTADTHWARTDLTTNWSAQCSGTGGVCDFAAPLLCFGQ